MNKEQVALLQLIRHSQFGSSDDLKLDGIDLDALYKEASLQAVLGLIAPSVVDSYPEEKWKQIKYRQIASYIKYCYVEEELNNLLCNSNIPFVILKGNAAAVAYSNPSLRTMGDIDFLVDSDDFEKTKQLLIENGYVLSPRTEKHPRHIGFSHNGYEFELHRRFSHEDVDIEKEIVEGFSEIKNGTIDDHCFPMLPRLSNGLVLLDHMRNHLKKGLGLRQVIDWMMYVYRNLDDDFWNEKFEKVTKEKGLDILAITATRMCQLYLGLPDTITWCKSADEKTCEDLLECLLVSGNFGRKNGQGNSIETVGTSIKRAGLFKWLQYAGEHNWEAYHKHHWLKPLCWIYQGFRYARQGIKTGRNRAQLKGDLDRSKERYELLKKLNINQ